MIAQPSYQNAFIINYMYYSFYFTIFYRKTHIILKTKIASSN
jgi:hypothetical protein